MSEIEQIKKALESATPGKWKPEYAIISSVISDEGNGVRTVIGTHIRRNDVELIANAPTWIRTLLEENERLENHNQAIAEDALEDKRQLQQLREELAEEKRHAALGWEQSGKWLEENGKLRVELDQVKKERDELLRLHRSAMQTVEVSDEVAESFRNEVLSLRTELAEKDKIFSQLKDIECTIGRFSEDRASYVGARVTRLYEEMQSILSQYKKGDTE